MVFGSCVIREKVTWAHEKRPAVKERVWKDRDRQTRKQRKVENDIDCLKVKAESKPYAKVIKLFS